MIFDIEENNSNRYLPLRHHCPAFEELKIQAGDAPEQRTLFESTVWV